MSRRPAASSSPAGRATWAGASSPVSSPADIECGRSSGRARKAGCRPAARWSPATRSRRRRSPAASLPATHSSSWSASRIRLPRRRRNSARSTSPRRKPRAGPPRRRESPLRVRERRAAGPAMKAYVAARAEAEAFLRDTVRNATFLRPWYVLGPGHRWPYALIPFYFLAEKLPATRGSTLRQLGASPSSRWSVRSSPPSTTGRRPVPDRRFPEIEPPADGSRRGEF